MSATVGREMGAWAQEGCGKMGTVPGGLILPGEGKIEEIRVELALLTQLIFRKSGREGLRVLGVHI